ncbi:MAG: ribonuclease HIII [Planctomycetota bacterium]|nr:ribonuclease HIII [Planctomycetota bacterium]
MTTTFKLSRREIGELRERLTEEGFLFKDLAYAHFQARGQGVVVAAYESGKVVVQGKGAGAFLDSFSLGAAPPTGPMVGSDESGKGDYFGPLVVAAVYVLPDQVADLTRAGVRDCKSMSDSAIMKAAVAIRSLCEHAVIALDPPAYNAQHETDGNVSIFLADMHADAIAQALGGKSAKIVIDQFTTVARLKKALKDHGVSGETDIRHKAEDNPAVAAASVLARAEFLIRLREAGHEYGVTLPKGAGAPVDRMARRLYQEFGIESLRALAKTHFRTTQKATERLF